MTNDTNKMNALIAACWKDDALKERFLSDPHAVLAEHGMDVPEGMNVNVVENGQHWKIANRKIENWTIVI